MMRQPGQDGRGGPPTAHLRPPVPGTGRLRSLGPSRPAGPAAPLRATDRDREAVVEVLQEAFATGRLGNEEHSQRLASALAARTYAELDPLTADLPERPAYPDAPRRPGPRRTNALAIAALACGIAQPLTLMLSTIPAIALGHAARRQIRRTGDAGHALATWGMILGWAGATAVAGLVAVLITLFVVLAHSL